MEVHIHTQICARRHKFKVPGGSKAIIVKKRWIAVLIIMNIALLLSGCGSAGGGDAVGAEAAEDTAGDSEETGGTGADSAEGAAGYGEEKDGTKDTAGDNAAGDGMEDAGGQDKTGGKKDAGGNSTGKDGVKIEDLLGDMTMDYSAAVAAVLSKSWDVEGKEETYTFSPDGSGEHGVKGGQEKFQYTCGFDEENNILVQITTEGKEKVYLFSSDETGYRLYMEDMEGIEDKRLLIPAGWKILDTKDEKVSGILGVWEDGGNNRYEFTEDNAFHILTSENSDGTFSIVEKEGEVREICILVAGGTLQYEYSLKDGGKTLELYSRGAESFYYWHRAE